MKLKLFLILLLPFLAFSRPLLAGNQQLTRLYHAIFQELLEHPAHLGVSCGDRTRSFIENYLLTPRYRHTFENAYIVKMSPVDGESERNGILMFDTFSGHIPADERVISRFKGGRQFRIRGPYFHHFFIVLDGRVFDFLQLHPRILSLQGYLDYYYLAPKGKPSPPMEFYSREGFNREERLSYYRRSTVQIYGLDEFLLMDEHTAPIYEGSAGNLFAWSGLDEDFRLESDFKEGMDSPSLTNNGINFFPCSKAMKPRLRK